MNPFRREVLARQRTPIRAEVPTPKEGESGAVVLRLYDPLDSWGGDWGVSAKEFAKVVDELPDDTSEIRLLINSPGGEVWEGLAILNSLRAHKAKVVAVVEGIAASAASFIATGVDELHMMKNAEIFIHNAWGLAVGNSADMAKLSSDLDHEDRNIASIYADKAGGTVDDWLAAMASETWYSADEAVTAGLADSVINAKAEGAESAKARFNTSVFALHGRAEPRATQKPPAPPVDTPPQKGADMDMSAQLDSGLRERLGISADAELNDGAILAALDEALAERVEPTTQVPQGTVLIEASILADLQANAAQGAQARAQQVAEQRARIVDSAIADGRITPARRDHWLAALNADPEGATETLNGLAKGLVPLAPQGYAGGLAEASDDDRLYEAAFGKGV